MKPLLECVADGYADYLCRLGIQPHEVCFVFPGKRAGIFFLKYFRRHFPESIAPEVTTIAEIAADIALKAPAERIELLFILYKCYLDLIGQTPENPTVSFHDFRTWGDTVLRDFNEVDMHRADADAIFRNVKDWRKIQSNFLTDGMKEVLEEYFGFVPREINPGRMWQHFNNPEEEEEIKEGKVSKRYRRLWEVLGPLYHRFHEAMEDEPIASGGMIYRLAAERLEKISESIFQDAIGQALGHKKIVFIGFNALTTSERDIFEAFASMDMPGSPGEPYADFVWDATGQPLHDRSNPAGRFVLKNAKRFPTPAWLMPYLKESETEGLPATLQTVAVPSNSMQAKTVGEMIAGEFDTIGREPFDRAKVAVILPDENLLLPLLYSLPERKDLAINLTMGYPLKLTAVASFIAKLRNLQFYKRDAKTYEGYDYEEFLGALTHPLMHGVIGTHRIAKFRRKCDKMHLRIIRLDQIAILGQEAVEIFRPLKKETTSQETIEYLDRALQIIQKSLLDKGEEGEMLKQRLEIANTQAWRDALRRLGDAVSVHGITLTKEDTFTEALRLIQSDKVAFEGEPLTGLQVMGMLETRAIDFDEIFILSCNDKILPRKARQRSFIPDMMRAAGGMPPAHYQEELFSYYFYRLISRAHKVTMLYDSRTGERGGGISRYLLQLRHLYAPGKIHHTDTNFRLAQRTPHINTIPKTDRILHRLERFSLPLRSREENEKYPPSEKQKNISASSLKDYCKCSLEFYLKRVEDINDDPAPSAVLDDISKGNAVHLLLEHLYIKDKRKHGKLLIDDPEEITAEMLKGYLGDPEDLERRMRRIINRESFHLPDDRLDERMQPGVEMQMQYMLESVKNVLKHDLLNVPFRIYGCEVKEQLRYRLPSGREVDMILYIDRLDDISRIKTRDPRPQRGTYLRIVDYKTGLTHGEAATVRDLFHQGYPSDHFLQLMTYDLLLREALAQKGHRVPETIRTVVYPTQKLLVNEDAGRMKINGKFVDDDSATVIPYAPVDPKRENVLLGATVKDLGDAPEGDGINILEEFRKHFEATLEEIFRPDVGFGGHYEESKCALCAFAAACRG